mmetsp:Transcript_9571/g.12500  ORF Transcript_9571/g.12500 Transcript_9571/m.12500 type:complete len:395 (-) Transcript_9571:1490-2674(-)
MLAHKNMEPAFLARQTNASEIKEKETIQVHQGNKAMEKQARKEKLPRQTSGRLTAGVTALLSRKLASFSSALRVGSYTSVVSSSTKQTKYPYDIQHMEATLSNIISKLKAENLFLQKDSVTFGRKIHKGKFGPVAKANFRGLECYAQTCSVEAKNDGSITETLATEILMLTTLHHPSLLQFLGAYAGSDCLHMVYGNYSERTLHDVFIQNPKSSHLSHVYSNMIEIGQALCYLHGAGIIHRNLSPGSILVGDNGHFVLSDLRHCKIVSQDKKISDDIYQLLDDQARLCASPEMVKGEAYDEKTDVYSFGFILYVLVSGETSLSNASPVEQIHSRRMTSRRKRRNCGGRYSRNLLQQLLTEASDERPDFFSIVEKLEYIQRSTLFIKRKGFSFPL